MNCGRFAGMDPPAMALTAAVVQIAIEPVSVGERAERILEVLGRVVPFDAASLSVRDPERQARYALAATGDVEALHAYCESPEGDTELDLIGLNRLTVPLRHTDLPMPAEDTLCWPQYLWPAGYAGSVGVGLFTPDGRHVGHLTVLTESSSRPTVDERDRIGAIARVMAHAVDRMREIRSAARVVGDAVAGVVVTRGGSAVRLPGLPDHRVLAPGSPVLAEAVERLDAGDAYAVFLHPAPDGGATGRLLRISVLDCRGGGVDHLKGIVLISPPPDLRGLTRQDLEILGFVVAGATDERIAVALEISTQVVAERIHRSGYLLAAPSRTGLAVRALRDGLFIPRRVPPGRDDPSRTQSDEAFEDS
jgi:DNA-binding CsgD family transcriptional regulator